MIARASLALFARCVVVAALLVLLARPTPAEVRPVDVAQYKDTIKVACVGDSITYGAGVEQRDRNNYPAVLGRMLGDKWEVRNFGVSGATMVRDGDRPYHKEKAYAAAIEYKPDVLIVKLGTNDSKPQNWKHADKYPADYKQLIEDFRKANEKVRVYVCLPVPVFGNGAFGITEKVVKEEVIPRAREVAKEANADVIDLYAALEGKAELVPDKVHPNAKGAAVMAGTVYQALTGKPPPQQE
jgi:acyl-CoA thioesterase I